MEDNISPDTRALTELIDASVRDLQNRKSPPRESLLFLGNWHESFPRLIFEDPILEPVDRNVWAAIRLKSSNNQATSFPSYEELQASCNISGKATIARAIAILRATRWITLCKRVRKNGRNAGNIYALHDEPLPLPDTLFLDTEYVPFLEKAATTHHHPRAREVCRAVLETIETDVGMNRDIMTPESGLNRRAEALNTLGRISTPETEVLSKEDLGQRFYSINVRGIIKLAKAANRVSRVQKLNPAFQGSKTEPGEKPQGSIIEPWTENPQHIEKQEDPFEDNVRKAREEGVSSIIELRSSSSSSSNKKHTTTTTATSLRFPEEMSENNRRIAVMYLKKIPEHQHQAVLDALDVKFQAIRQGGGRWRYGPIPYLRKLCNAVLEGTFVEMPATAQRKAQENRESARERADLIAQIHGLDELMSAPGAAEPTVAELRKIRGKLIERLKQMDEESVAGETAG